MEPNKSLMMACLRDTNFGSLRQPVYDALEQANIQTVSDLVLKTENEVYQIPGVGSTSVRYLKYGLNDYNLNFGMSEEEIKKDSLKKTIKDPNEISNIRRDFIGELICTSERAAKKSLDSILEKKSWSAADIDKYFAYHLQIITTYKESLMKLHDD